MEPVVGETVKFLLEKLFETANTEYNLVRNFKKDLINFKKYLEKVNGVLEDAKRREIEDESVKSWLKHLEDVVYDADTILDEINYEYLRRQIESQDEIVKQKIKWCWNIPCCSADNTSLTFKHKMAHKIKDINDTFKRIYDEAKFLRLSRVNDYPLAKRLVIEQTTSILADPDIVGREHDEEVIREKIVSSTCDDVLSVIPIVGMGGLGKTTLARKIFNHSDTQNHFNEKIWICVSEDFDQLTLFKKMLELLKEDFHGGNKEVIVRKLKEKLNGKRYLLVLDDLWNQEKQLWDEFIYTLMGVNPSKGNAIIVTTRNIEVASIVNPFEDPYTLGKLSDEDCWSVIKAKAFSGGDVPMQFQSIGKDIARRCGGLPLLANMMGGVLARKGIDVWKSILQTELSNLQVGDTSGAIQVIKVSYDHLPNASVKKCFAYCSLFIKDSVIKKDDLIQLWMAEGFLGNDPRSDMENTGNNIFNMLLQNSFFQEAEKDMYGNIVNCKMHDLVHELASLISKSENLICMEGPTVDDIPCVRRLVANSIGQDRHKDIKENAGHLRTLILKRRVPNEILPFFKRLYVLKLCDAGIDDLPDSIGKLIHLRYLDVSDCYLHTLPDSICKLFNLQTLRILQNPLDRLPKDLQFLIHLRHLIFDSVRPDFEMPPKIGTLSCLETLTQFFVSDKDNCRIDELGGLKNLKGILSIYNLELVCSKTEAENADIAGKIGIYALHLYWGDKERTNNARENRIINDESILGALQPHANLKWLKIDGFRDEEFPLWTRNMKIYKKGVGGNMGMMLDQLIEIKFIDCRGVKEIPMLGHLPRLKFLKLERLSQVTCIGLSFYGVSDDGQETRVSFPSLLRLEIMEMENLTEWTEPRNNDGVQVLPRLEKFFLHRCQKLSHVPFLRAVGASLQMLWISNCDELMELPSDLCSLESLKELGVRDCNNLRLIRPRQNGQKALASLQRLIIFGCRNLTSLHELSGMGSLLYLEVRRCPSLTALPQLNEMGSLQHLTVAYCDNLIYLPEMSGMGCLQYLEVIGCMNLISPPELSGMGCINSLRKLAIDSSSEMQFNSFEACLDGIQHMKSLQDLQLFGQDDWVYLPHQIQHLTSLKKLMVSCFGIEALPDWLGKLSSLQVLRLYFCEKLKQLPSKDAMLQLNKLIELDIFGCPLLKERCNEDSGPASEWQKISHISDIYVD